MASERVQASTTDKVMYVLMPISQEDDTLEITSSLIYLKKHKDSAKIREQPIQIRPIQTLKHVWKVQNCTRITRRVTRCHTMSLSLRWAVRGVSLQCQVGGRSPQSTPPERVSHRMGDIQQRDVLRLAFLEAAAIISPPKRRAQLCARGVYPLALQQVVLQQLLQYHSLKGMTHKCISPFYCKAKSFVRNPQSQKYITKKNVEGS